MYDIYKNKTVVITGHTGFKGAWLALWLRSLGANVVGIALKPTTEPSLFSACGLEHLIQNHFVDIRSAKDVNVIVANAQPDFIFHMAAQALVRKSYSEPIDTWTTNCIGSISVLDSLRALDKKCAAIFVTSDKCYENKEWTWGYRESDALGGRDPYSASKAAAELAIYSYINSFFPKGESNSIRIASVRAGNVIGGGDWSDDRIIPDCVRAWSRNEVALLRNPNSTRPWQHVLEPLRGYLTLASHLYNENKLHGEAFNFGPIGSQNFSVLNLVEGMARYWKAVKWKCVSVNNRQVHEAGLLKLNCDKALSMLNWKPSLTFDQTIELTAAWYEKFYKNPDNALNEIQDQIKIYEKLVSKTIT